MVGDAPNYVYRLYDEDDALLYVGIAIDTDRRIGQHRGKEWWPQVVRHSLAEFPSRALAEKAEQHAIQTEDPRHNLLHSRINHRPPRAQTGLPADPSLSGVPVDHEAWTGGQCAAFWGVGPSTWRAYVARGYAPRPQPGYDDDRQRRWDAELVRAYERPGRGKRTDLARKVC